MFVMKNSKNTNLSIEGHAPACSFMILEFKGFN